MAKKAIVVPAVPAVAESVSLTAILTTPLSHDTVADVMVRIGDVVEGVGRAYHYTMDFLIGCYGKDAVFSMNGNKCRDDAARKKFAAELDMDFPGFMRLYDVFKTVNTRRPDCWRQAKNCYTTIEESKTAPVVSVQDKPELILSLEIELEEVKAQATVAKANKRRAELEVMKGKLDGIDTTELQLAAAAAKEDFEAIDEQRRSIQANLQAERDKAKESNRWAEYAKLVERLAEFCKKHEEYKDILPKVLDLMNV